MFASKIHVQEFHDHLNSINPNIQFTKEIAEDNRLSFLDTSTSRVHGHVHVSVYQKPTHGQVPWLKFSQWLIHSLTEPNESHQQMQSDREKGNTWSRCSRITMTCCILFKVVNLTATLLTTSHITATLPPQTQHHRPTLSLCSHMSEAYLRNFPECYVITAWK